MKKINEQKTNMENLLRLESLREWVAPAGQESLEEVIDSLRAAIGESVSKKNAAHFLSVSRQTVDRWIAEGLIPLSEEGGGVAREAVEKISQEMSHLQSAGETRHILATALRRAADNLDPKQKTSPKKTRSTASKNKSASKNKTASPRRKPSAAKKTASSKK